MFGLAAIAAWSSPYRRDRLLTFLDPWKDPTGSGLQNVQALISFGSGGIFGRGLGQGLAPLYYLPEAHTDMMFAVVGEELGLVGVALVIMAFCAFGYAGIRLAIACRRRSTWLPRSGWHRSPGSRFRSSPTAARVSS